MLHGEPYERPYYFANTELEELHKIHHPACCKPPIAELSPTAHQETHAVPRIEPEPIDAFAARWSSQLLPISSPVSMAGALARFDFSWFIPALVKYRKLLGEVLLISFMRQLL